MWEGLIEKVLKVGWSLHHQPCYTSRFPNVVRLQHGTATARAQLPEYPYHKIHYIPTFCWWNIHKYPHFGCRSTCLMSIFCIQIPSSMHGQLWMPLNTFMLKTKLIIYHSPVDLLSRYRYILGHSWSSHCFGAATRFFKISYLHKPVIFQELS
jgi:hypothetical protein